MTKCFPGLALFVACASAGAAAAQPTEVTDQPMTLNAAQLFDFGDRARDTGDFDTAEKAYRALAGDPDRVLRSEARFRLAMMLADKQRKYREAAVLLRQILDEEPKAGRVRLELARMRAMMGDIGAAERELRAAQAAGLPRDVEQLVRFYANALSSRKPFGGSLEFALAPDSNINRATRSDTLGTVIGDFTLDEDAKARSGVGASLRGQTYLRMGIERDTDLLVRLSGRGDFYRASQFDDYALSLQLGPQYTSGSDRISISAGPAWRWYGRDPFSFTIGARADWQHPMGRRTQLRVEGGISHIDNRRNDLQDGESYMLSAAIDRAFTARSGGGLQIQAGREDARDPGYATTLGGANLYAFRELGRTTAVLSLGYSHLEADGRLFLYPRRRVEYRFTASLAGTFRSLRVASFAPFARIYWERNASTIELYDFKRISAEFGITSAF